MKLLLNDTGVSLEYAVRDLACIFSHNFEGVTRENGKYVLCQNEYYFILKVVSPRALELF